MSTQRQLRTRLNRAKRRRERREHISTVRTNLFIIEAKSALNLNLTKLIASLNKLSAALVRSKRIIDDMRTLNPQAGGR